MDRRGSSLGLSEDEKDARVKVICRFRPQNQKEINEHGRELMRFEGDTTVEVTSVRHLACSWHEKESLKLDVQSIDGNANRFTFDRVIRPSARQVEVYDYGDRFRPGVCMAHSQQHALPQVPRR